MRQPQAWAKTVPFEKTVDHSVAEQPSTKPPKATAEHWAKTRKVVRRDFSARAFKIWLEKNKLNTAETARFLGCSRNSIEVWKKNGASYYIGLACAAIDHDLDIPEDNDEIVPSTQTTIDASE